MIPLGTTVKINVSMEPMDNYHMSEVDWYVEVFSQVAYGKGVKVNKDSAVKVDDDNYIVVIDTGKVGIGPCNLSLTAYIPDAHCPDGIRIEKAVVEIDTTIGV